MGYLHRGVMMTVGCCIIPCIRGLFQRLRNSYLCQNNLFLLDTTEHESQLMLTEFEEKNVDE
jgi:hypothetical protein